MFIDSHCHLTFDELYQDRENYFQLMKDAKVDFALSVATNVDNQDRIVEIINNYDHIFGSVGIHPDEDLPTDFVLTEEYLLRYALNSKIIAIGETGLDYYRLDLNADQDKITAQKIRFMTHIEVANQTNLPLIIHTRGDSHNDILNIMSEMKAQNAVMHCFTENLDVAKRCLDMGYYISISGIVTFKNATQVQEVAKYVPLDRLLIETDAPFLAPVPFRGKLNHPALVSYTAEYIAGLRQVSVLEIAINTSSNFKRLFKVFIT